MLISSYKPLSKKQLFKAVVESESLASDRLAEVYDSRGDTQVRSALHRVFTHSLAHARTMRMKASKRTHRLYENPRYLMEFVLTSAVILAAASSNEQKAVLLVVCIAAFSGHIAQLHGVVETLLSVQANGEKLLDSAQRPRRPAVIPREDGACIETKGLVITYPEKEIPFPDLSIPQGVIGILDLPNGWGKSSFLKAIAGVVDYRGSLLVWGQEARDADVSDASIIFKQDRAANQAVANDLFGDHICKERQQHALDLVNGQDIDLTTPYGNLSGGQKQKIDLARKLYQLVARRSGLVTIDEPTNNLDIASLERLRITLPQVLAAAEGMTVIIAAHDPDLVKNLKSLPSAFVLNA